MLKLFMEGEGDLDKWEDEVMEKLPQQLKGLLGGRKAGCIRGHGIFEAPDLLEQGITS